MNPSEEYKRRLQLRQERVEYYKKLEHLVGNLRLAVGIAFFGIAWLVAGRGAISGFWLLAPVIAFVALVGYHEKIRARGRKVYRAVLFYERGLARIEDRWITSTARPTEPDELHLYATDLDIFGKGSLFELLSLARTRSGEQTLASWLKSAAAPEEIRRRQQAIHELRNHLDLREDLAVLGEDVRAAIHPDWMKQWSSRLRILNNPPARIAAPFLSAFMIAGLIIYYGLGGSGWFLVVAVALGGGFGMFYRPGVRAVVDAVGDPAKDLQTFSVLLERIEREQWTTSKLSELRAALATEGLPASREIHRLGILVEWLNSRLNPVIAALGPLMLWSTQFAFAIEHWRAQHGSSVGRWLDTVGEIEALCSLSAYAYEHPDDPFPEIVEGDREFAGDDMRHPLLPSDKCVANSVRLNQEQQILIISGSNMSGKSTLLRTVGVNAVLAFAGAPVRAKRLQISILAIGATMRVMDSLQQGTSRFYAEIQRLHDIMELAKNEPVLFLLDEILHGTNSHDRAVGAEAVIRGLLARGAIGLVTTHDLALAKLADNLAPRAANYHFQDHLENGRMVFDYHLYSGVVQKSNALELMRAVGLDV